MEEKIVQKIVAIGIPIIVFTTVACVIPNAIGIIIAVAGTMISAPLLDKKLTEIKIKENKYKIKEKHYLEQLKIGLAEMDRKGTRVNSITPFFTEMITRKCEKNKIIIDEDTLQNINQFLYMVNSNYYEQILNTLKINNERLKSREDVIRDIIDLILINMEINEDYAFDDRDVRNVLERCLFIKEEIKEEMIKEFEEARVPGVLGKDRYIIERKDVKIDTIEKDYNKKYNEEKKDNISFDIYEKESYIQALAKISEMEHYKKLGNISTVSWDLDALMDVVITIIDNYDSKLENSINKYSIARFAVKHILTIASYVLVNKKSSVGYKEIIESFGKMQNIPTELQLEISRFLKEKNATKMNQNSNQKILIFNPNYTMNQN